MGVGGLAMEYTDKQYEMLGRLSGGLDWRRLPGGEMECVRYLIDHGLAQYREDICPGYTALTEEGRRVLQLHDVHVRQKQEEQEEARRIAEREAAAKAAERTSDRKFQIRLTFLQAFLSFFTGLISGAVLSNLDRLLPWCAEIVRWACALIRG